MLINLFLDRIEDHHVPKVTSFTKRIIRLKFIIASAILFCSVFVLIKIGGFYLLSDQNVISMEETPIEFWTIISVIFTGGVYFILATLKIRKGNHKRHLQDHSSGG